MLQIKSIFLIILLFLLMMLTKADIICRDTETNVEYLASDSTVERQIENLSALYEKKVDKLLKHLDERFDSLNFAKSENIISKYSNCMEVMSKTHHSGVYEIQLPSVMTTPFDVFCNDEAHYGGWTVVMRRFDGSVNFNRNWMDYKSGFGSLRSEFFIGLEKLHAMTSYGPIYELLIMMTNFDNISKYAKYNSFVIGGEADGYILKQLGNYSGNAGDALTHHLGRKFTTRDKDNDIHPERNCATEFNGAWWFTKCYECFLFAPYEKEYNKFGMLWIPLSNNLTNLKFVEMLIRPI